MLLSLRTRKGIVIFSIILLILISAAVGKALSVSSPWINFALLGGLIFAYIGGIFFFHRKLILALYLLAIVNLDYLRLMNEPFNVTVDILFSLTLVLLALPLLLTRRFRWHLAPIQKAFLLYLAATLICVLFSIDPLVSFKRWMRYASYYILIGLFLDTARDKATIEKFSLVLICSAFVPCLIGYYGLLTQSPSYTSANLFPVYGIDMVRIKSTLSHANTFGLYLSIIIPLSIGFLLGREDYWKNDRKLFLSGTLLITLPLLYYTYSRIGWISTAIIIFLVLVFHKRWRLLTVTPWLLGFLIWRMPTFITRWSDVIDPMQPDSLDWRRGLYAFSLKKFTQRPVFGSGPGTFMDYVAFGKGYSPHQLWIGSLVEVGLVGTLAMAILLVIVGAQLIKYARKQPTPLNLSALAIFSGLMFVSIAGDPFNLPSIIIYLWALISLATAEFRLLPGEPPGKAALT